MPGSWVSFNAPAGVSADTMLLLTDGSVLVHNADGSAGPGLGGADWYRLTPDAAGDYASGTWSPALRMATERQFFATAVLNDGRVFAVGGEYATGLKQDQCAAGEIFDPRTNVWTPMNKPSPEYDFIAGDCPAIVLADGRVLFAGNPDGSRTALWDPATDRWREAGLDAQGAQTKQGPNNEETWTLLPSGNVLTVQISGTTPERNAEQYVPHLDRWVSAGHTTQELVVGQIAGVDSDEIGPALLLPNGQVIAFGGNGLTEFFTPDTDPAQPGVWAAGPPLPADADNPLSPAGRLTILDGPAALLPGGKVLCAGGPTRKVDGNEGPTYWSGPARLLQHDPEAGTVAELPEQPQVGDGDTWAGSLLLLPNGHMLYSVEQNTLAEYVPSPDELAADPAWQPAITDCPRALVPGEQFMLSGTLLNGMSHAVSYGDDRQAATNYPIVRLTRGDGTVRYLRTFGFSWMGVADRDRVVTTQCEVPLDLAASEWELVVIANGIASPPRQVTVNA